MYFFYYYLQVWFFDEIGLISWEFLAVIDKVLRIIKDCQAPFGGSLFFCSGDHYQLLPINGQPVWNSPLLLSAFRCMMLEHLVRSQGDAGTVVLGEIVNTFKKS